MTVHDLFSGLPLSFPTRYSFGVDQPRHQIPTACGDKQPAASSIYDGKEGRLYISDPDSGVATSVFFNFYVVLGHLPEERLEFAGKGRETTTRFHRIQADRTIEPVPISLSGGHVETGRYVILPIYKQQLIMRTSVTDVERETED